MIPLGRHFLRASPSMKNPAATDAERSGVQDTRAIAYGYNASDAPGDYPNWAHDCVCGNAWPQHIAQQLLFAQSGRPAGAASVHPNPGTIRRFSF